jgi:hypothetical protein
MRYLVRTELVDPLEDEDTSIFTERPPTSPESLGRENNLPAWYPSCNRWAASFHWDSYRFELAEAATAITTISPKTTGMMNPSMPGVYETNGTPTGSLCPDGMMIEVPDRGCVAMIEHGARFPSGQIEIQRISIRRNGDHPIQVVAENRQGLAGGHSRGNNGRGQRGRPPHIAMRMV